MSEKKVWEEWSETELAAFQETFIQWYEQEKRNLPWRYNQDPYRIWISEIMLQQTRVDTVIDYFYRFMDWFPDIETLANAPEEKLLKAWEGLGYYSRVRNIQAAAKQIVEEFGGRMPADIEKIKTLKGVGPYTAGAIASIAFDLPEPAIDGNVMRVVSRLFCIEADIAKASSRKIFDEAMRKILTPDTPGEFNQAMMDLGSSICTPTSPDCENCPIQAYCLSEKLGKQTEFPVKTKKAKPKDKYYLVAAIEDEKHQWYLEQRPSKGLLAGMQLFPMIEVSKERFDSVQHEWSKEQLQPSLFDLSEVAETETDFFDLWPVVWQKRHLGEVTHVFSHLRWHLLVFYGRKSVERGNSSAFSKGDWLTNERLAEIGLPKPQLKMMDQLEKNKKLR